jgi:hypothetical protein
MRNRYRAAGEARLTDDSELILCNLSFRRELFLSFGGLDERLYPNEENELLDRMLSAGARLVHDPELAVTRSQRPGWRLLWRQFLNYGRGRAEQSLISRRLKPASLVPALFVAYLALLPFVRGLAFMVPIRLYLLLVVVVSLAEAVSCRRWWAFPRLLALFPAIHVAYGTGVWWGLSGFRPRTGADRATGVTVRRLKGFGDPAVRRDNDAGMPPE